MTPPATPPEYGSPAHMWTAGAHGYLRSAIVLLELAVEEAERAGPLVPFDGADEDLVVVAIQDAADEAREALAAIEEVWRYSVKGRVQPVLHGAEGQPAQSAPPEES